MTDAKADTGAGGADELGPVTKISRLSELADVLDLFDLNIRRAADRAVEIPRDLDTKLSKMYALSNRAIEASEPDCDHTVAVTGMLYLIRYLRDHDLSDFEVAFALNCTAKEKLGKWGDPLNPSWQMFHIYLSWIRKDIVGMSTGSMANLPPYVSESQPGFQRADIITISEFPEIQGVTDHTFPTDPTDPSHLCVIGTALARRFEVFHDRDDIDKAVEYGLKAASSSSSSPPSHASCSHRLATSLLIRFDYFKVESDIYDAAQYNMLAFQVLTDISVSESFRDSLELQVDSVLKRLTSPNSDSVDLSLAQKVTEFDEFYISVLRPFSPILLIARLAFVNFYESYFLKSGGFEPTHIHRVIEHCTRILESESVFLYPKYHSNCLYRLATAYQHRFNHSQDESDWNLHIHYLEAYTNSLEATNLQEDATEELKDARRRLALALIRRFNVSKDPSDLEAAKQFHELSVRGLDPNLWHPHDHFFPAALSFSSWHESGDQTSLEDGFAKLRQTLEGIANFIGEPTQPQSFLTHAVSVYIEWMLTGSPDSAASCIDTCRDIATSPWAGPEVQMRAAVMWGQVAFIQGRSECLDAFHIAATLSPEVSSLWLGRKLEERYGGVSRLFSSVHSMATSAALIFGNKVDLAIEYYEQGLAINYRQLLQLKSETRELEQAEPTLARRLTAVSAKLFELSHQVPTDFVGLEPAAFSDEKMAIAAEYRKVVAEIRTKPGFEKLFLALPYQQLSIAADEGPVIMLTHAYQDYAYALVMLDPTRAPVALSLPAVTQEAVDGFTQKLTTLLYHCNALRGGIDGECEGRPSKSRSPGSVNEREFKEILEWLWSGIVNPVFEELERNGITEGRIWWCPSDVFTRFPLHAAAPIDCPFIQSYTYTLESLIKARTASRSFGPHTQAQMAVVGVSQYPEYSPLDCVLQELQIISNLAKDRSSWLQLTKLEDEMAGVEAVLNAIKKSHIVHLACHGEQNRDKPLESGLILNNGTLTLEKLLAEDLRQAQFVLLSACQTATGDENNMNESLHLAGGFMAAGFKGAIGTLWSIYDSDAPVVAKILYETIISDKGIGIRKAAEGLQEAVRYLREEGVSHERWVPFIHVGV